MSRPRIAIVGAGRMGIGLAQVFAYAGHPVDLIDAKPRDADASQATRAEIGRGLEMLASLGVFDADRIEPILARITVHSESAFEAAVADGDVVLEGVPERLEAKQAVLGRIGAAARHNAIVASATSTFLVDTLAGYIARPERFLNGHWLNPAFLVPLVEVSPGRATAPAVVERFTALLAAVGKVPVVCAASPGFIVPRLQALVMNEAARMVEEGVASPEEIDRATRYGLGFRFAAIGVVEFIDWGGGDILHYASAYLRDALGADRFAAPAVIGRNMAEGRTGMKTGQGFYDFRGRDLAAYQHEVLARFVDLLRHHGLLKEPAADAADLDSGAGRVQ